MSEPKNSQSKKKKKSQTRRKNQDPKRLKDIQIPVDLPIPECGVCEKKRADFYCTKCEIHYCQNCEPEVHTSFWKKKHRESIFKVPYIPNKDDFQNKCQKHKKELILYCETEQTFICIECNKACYQNNHITIPLDLKSQKYLQKLKEISLEISQKTEKYEQIVENNKEKLEELKKIIYQTTEKIQKNKQYQNKIQDITNLDQEKENIQIINESRKIIEETNKIKDRKTKKKIEKKRILQAEMERVTRLKKTKRREREKQMRFRIVKEMELEKKNRLISLKLPKEKFNPRMNQNNLVKITNNNRTISKPKGFILKVDTGAIFRTGVQICGKNIYSKGKHEIKIKIDKFPMKGYNNFMEFGVFNLQDQENFILKQGLVGDKTCYSFCTYWCRSSSKTDPICSKSKHENGKKVYESYASHVHLNEGDILILKLNMDKKKIKFIINKKKLGVGFKILPERVLFYANISDLHKTNQITLI
ncbi:tripartite motif-containing protein [Anaeramoeba flamelloides]|uniref:Tripartite motif-containing protein n=1 Tax=Anaeramoeba flamelloides TaxID=1746091 RepID=A0ABQ8YS79_9EUKA|nr:tripartite motif-containing protein [Anaeramoeba flamelloides]